MPSFEENIETIGTAVYGKEMRPAIKEALLQSQENVGLIEQKIKELQEKIDEITGGGGGGGDEPDTPDEPVDPDTPTGCYMVDSAVPLTSGIRTPLSAVGDADEF